MHDHRIYAYGIFWSVRWYFLNTNFWILGGIFSTKKNAMMYTFSLTNGNCGWSSFRLNLGFISYRSSCKFVFGVSFQHTGLHWWEQHLSVTFWFHLVDFIYISILLSFDAWDKVVALWLEVVIMNPDQIYKYLSFYLIPLTEDILICL